MVTDQVAPLEASVIVQAPAEAVWAVLKDQRRMKVWSPETMAQWFWPRRLARGQLSLNLNRRGFFVWPTLSRYVDVVPEQQLAFHVYGPAARWGYTLTRQGSATRLSLRRDLARGRPTVLSRIVATLALGGIHGHDVELLEGMESTLAAIAAEAQATIA